MAKADLTLPYFFERIIYYTSIVYSRQLPDPFKYEKLVPVIFVAVLSHVFDDRYEEAISKHAIMNTKHHSISSEHTMYYLVELPKFRKKEDELETDEDKWLFFMKKAEKCKEIPEALRKDKNFIEAFDVLERMKWSEADLLGYLAAEDAAGRDERIEKGAFEKGQKVGHQEGKTKGIQEGIQQEKLEMACRLLQEKMDIDFIIKITGLSTEQIKNLCKLE